MKTSSDSPSAPISRRALLVSALLLGAGCAATSTPKQGPQPAIQGLQVTVLVYSGRPNPSFVLEDSASLEHVRSALSSATEMRDFRGGTVLPSILGYNGVVVANPSRLAGLPASIAIHREKIEVHDGKTRFLTDGGALEAWLIDRAREKKLLGEREIAVIGKR